MQNELHTVHLTINGKQFERDVEPRTLLSDFLRHEIGLTGTHVSLDGRCEARSASFTPVGFASSIAKNNPLKVQIAQLALARWARPEACSSARRVRTCARWRWKSTVAWILPKGSISFCEAISAASSKAAAVGLLPMSEAAASWASTGPSPALR